MTNLKDNTNSQKYSSLVFVEMLEMICRVSHSYWNARQERKEPRTDIEVTPYPRDIAEEVEEVLKSLFEKRITKADATKKMKDKLI